MATSKNAQAVGYTFTTSKTYLSLPSLDLCFWDKALNYFPQKITQCQVKVVPAGKLVRSLSGCRLSSPQFHLTSKLRNFLSTSYKLTCCRQEHPPQTRGLPEQSSTSPTGRCQQKTRLPSARGMTKPHTQAKRGMEGEGWCWGRTIFPQGPQETKQSTHFRHETN